MAFQRIRIKNTNVPGKVPGKDKLDKAELCVNLKDHKLYSKDADGEVFELGAANVPSGPTPPTINNEIGDLFFDTNLEILLYWDGTEWVPVAGQDQWVVDRVSAGSTPVITPQDQGTNIGCGGTSRTNPDASLSTDGRVFLRRTDGTDDPKIVMVGEQGTLVVSCDGEKWVFDNDFDIDAEGKAHGASTKDTDPDNTLVTKDYVDANSGGGGEVPSGGTGDRPTGPEIGDLYFDTDLELLLVWNGTEWQPVGDAPVTSVNGETGDVVLDLGDINDVTLTNVDNGDIIAWNGNAWVNTAAPPADISGSSISDLNDVDTAGVDDGDILVWNQADGEWQPSSPPAIPEKTSELVNDGNGDPGEVFITQSEVTNILDGNKPDGTPDPNADKYLKEGDKISLLDNDAGYITDAGVTKIIAGTGIEVAPVEGTGDVTINSTVSSTEFVGPVDVTSSTVPAMVRSANALYVNTGTGTFSPEWAAVTSNADVTTEATPGDFMMKDLESQASDPWTWIDAGIEPSTDGLWIEDSGKLYPTTLTNNVGIGVDAPSTKLDVNGDIKCIPNAYVSSNIYYSGGWKYASDGPAGFVKLAQTGTEGIAFNTAPSGTAGAAASPATRMFIKADNGNVGIGTDSPETELHVSSTQVPKFTIERSGTNNPAKWSISAGNNRLLFTDEAANVERMRIDSTGNVGIGTNIPMQKLHVNGKVRATDYDLEFLPPLSSAP